MEYSKKQLAEIAQGCFKNSNEPAFYANVNGTFLNANQKSKLSKEDQEKLIEFKNPKFAEAEEETEEQKAQAAAKAAAKAEADAKKAAEKEEKEKAVAEAKAKKEAEAAAKAAAKAGK